MFFGVFPKFKEIFIFSFLCLFVKLQDIRQWHGDSALYVQKLVVGTHPATTELGAVTAIHTHNFTEIYSGYPEELQAVYSQT